jgi:uncharacterized protein YqgQ
VINEALYFGDRMSHMVLCPNQLRANGWKVQDMPKQFKPESAHAIIDPTGRLKLPLELNGIISYLPTRKPMKQEMEECSTFELMSAQLWEPYNSRFLEREEWLLAEATTGSAPAANEPEATPTESEPVADEL